MTNGARPLPRAEADRIARAFLPERTWGNRHHYFYSRSKLASDPLYTGVVSALEGSTAPVLDLGCGLGLLAHALRARDCALPYLGVDNDAGKIASARRAGARAALTEVTFATVNLATGTLPVHQGSVTLLDVLQYLPPERQTPLLEAAIDLLVPGSRLIVRTGLADGSSRAGITRLADVMGHALGWMNTAPGHYPRRDQLQAVFDAHGLHSTFSPLSGNTPFNNWRIVVQRH